MKNLIPLLLIFCMVACSQPAKDRTEDLPEQDTSAMLQGAWQTTVQTDSVPFTAMVIVSDGYLSAALYDRDGRSFIGASGGSFRIIEDTLFETYEYNTMDTSKVGTTDAMAYLINGDSLEAAGRTWTRVDGGTPGALAGAWLITGRMKDGEISRSTPGVRKTMKVLSGTRFQWIAYNTETAQFFGTGGGTYTTTDSVYTENIEFFSRDSSRVGASLEFTYQLDSGEWHHSGYSSKGEPLYEIWTPRSMVE